MGTLKCLKEMNINLVIHMDPVVINDEQANELETDNTRIFR